MELSSWLFASSRRNGLPTGSAVDIAGAAAAVEAWNSLRKQLVNELRNDVE